MTQVHNPCLSAVSPFVTTPSQEEQQKSQRKGEALSSRLVTRHHDTTSLKQDHLDRSVTL